MEKENVYPVCFASNKRKGLYYTGRSLETTGKTKQGLSPDDLKQK